MRRSSLVLMSLLVGGCGSESEEPPIAVSTGPLSGVVNGQAWTYLQGSADPAFSAPTDPTLFTTLFGQTYGSACGVPPVVEHLILEIPKTPGDYPFSLSRTGTFYVPPADNSVATRGRLIVEEVTQTKVTARLHMIFDAQNEVDGRFVADVCP